jgi:hypothetical protein
MKNQPIPFHITPGVPILIRVENSYGDEYELQIRLAIEEVWEVQDSPLGREESVFGIEYASKIETTLVKRAVIKGEVNER